MVRVKEVLVLEDVGFADEKFGGGLFALSFRTMMYLFFGGILGYKLIASYTVGGIVVGSLILLGALAFAFYPPKSVRLEALVIQAFFFYLTPRRAKAAKPRKTKKQDKENMEEGQSVEVEQSVETQQNMEGEQKEKEEERVEDAQAEQNMKEQAAAQSVEAQRREAKNTASVGDTASSGATPGEAPGAAPDTPVTGAEKRAKKRKGGEAM